MHKTKLFMTAITLGIGLAMTGCGGGSNANVVVLPEPIKARVSGNVTGLPDGITILLVNNGNNIISVNSNSTFSFDKLLEANSPYNVTLFTQPSGAACKISDGVGLISPKADNVTNVAVTCSIGLIAFSSYNVGVTVSGLSQGGSITFLNNGGDALVVNGNGLNVFSKNYGVPSIPYGPNFNVTISAPAPGQVCSLSNASGDVTQLKTNFANVLVSCK